MKKLENILAENMRRFGTKNLSERNLDDLENKLGFDSGANRDPKTGNLINQDSDANNNGYPDTTEIIKSKSEWWNRVKQDLAKWNAQQHPDDRLSIQDWIGEVGPTIYGWTAFQDSDGDWDVRSDDDEFDEDEYDDDYF